MHMGCMQDKYSANLAALLKGGKYAVGKTGQNFSCMMKYICCQDRLVRGDKKMAEIK